MTTLADVKNQLPDYAKDIKLNVSMVIEGDDGAPGLTELQRRGCVLAAALATGHSELIRACEAHAVAQLDAANIQGVATAAAVMAMNNIYYRSVHLMSDHSYLKLPAKLRMNAIGNPGIPKPDFELYSLAVSAVNGCGMCLDSHEKVLRAHFSQEGVQSALRIAAVIHAVAAVLTAEAARA